MERNNHRGLPSTIVLGVLLTIALCFAIPLCSMNLKEALKEYALSLQETELENMGEMVLVFSLAAGIGALAIALVSYVFAIVPSVIAGISLIFSLRNRKCENATIRTFNLIYDFVFSAILLLGISKIILFVSGIG